MAADFFSVIVPASGRIDLPRHFVGKSVTVTEEKLTRSQKANRYYWSVVLGVAHRAGGQPKDDIHDAMVFKFLPNKIKQVRFFNLVTGEEMTVEVDARRSSSLNRSDFYDFVENVRLWIAEFYGASCPDPDPDYWRKR